MAALLQGQPHLAIAFSKIDAQGFLTTLDKICDDRFRFVKRALIRLTVYAETMRPRWYPYFRSFVTLYILKNKQVALAFAMQRARQR